MTVLTKKMSKGLPVTIGFIVKKRWKEGEKNREKRVSRLLSSISAAETFAQCARTDYAAHPVDGESSVEFFITNDIGTDGLPESL